MFFALPWMLLGLLGLPALTAIYWLRSRSRPRVVSSLFLWSDQRIPRQGGKVVEKLQTPLVFFLELIALAAMALAAAAPALVRSQYSRPLVIVLDDSYSMQAGDEKSFRDQATQKLAAEFRRINYVARIILAGAKPRLLSAVIRTPDELHQALQDWKCNSPIAGLDSAISLASEIGGETSRILVLSDHPPDADLSAGKIQWWGFGAPLGNLAFTAAARDAVDGGDGQLGDRVLLEITNFSSQPAQASLVLAGMSDKSSSRQAVNLAAGAASRIILNIPDSTGILQARLDANDLQADNSISLVSSRKRPLRVQLAIAGTSPAAQDLQSSLTRALDATGQCELVHARPELIITNRIQPSTEGAHQWEILNGPEPVSFEGPFVMDRSHPLTTGVSLEAVIWTAPKEVMPEGNPIITAGNHTLMTDIEQVSGRHLFQTVLTPALSNLMESPDWPILMTNLVRWCLASVPGPAMSNVRLGQQFKVTLSTEAVAVETATMTAPDGTTQTLPVHGKLLELQGDVPGLYEVKIGPMQFPFACNAVNVEESNLSTCETGQWGQWNLSDVYQDQHLNLDWICILLALSCLMFELMILTGRGVSSS